MWYFYVSQYTLFAAANVDSQNKFDKKQKKKERVLHFDIYKAIIKKSFE